MTKARVSLGLLLISALPACGQHHEKPLVTFESATQCHGAHADWRWSVKTDTDPPPSSIPPDHHIKPSDIAAWDAPLQAVKSRTPRFGREMEWFVATGRVARVKAEEDGDLHIELRDQDNPHSVRIVVEVPLDRHGGKTPWNPIHEIVFGVIRYFRSRPGRGTGFISPSIPWSRLWDTPFTMGRTWAMYRTGDGRRSILPCGRFIR
jgi:hypothetical protein